MTFPVVRLPPECWDQAFVVDTLTRLGGAFVDGFGELPADTTGAAVMVPARYFVDRVDELNDHLGHLEWAVVLLVSDEESLFPWDKLTHQRLITWVMTPRPGQHDSLPGHRFLPHGLPPDTTRLLGDCSEPDRKRRYNWSFAGQINHPRRRAMVQALRGLRRGKLARSRGFTQGLPKADYLALLADTKVAPCPSGPATPDSFRLWEALEAGCVPVADAACPAYDAGYWPLMFGAVPFPTIQDWSALPDLVGRLVGEWPQPANRTWAWWAGWKRETRRRIAEDVNDLAGERLASFPHPGTVAPDLPDAQITVLIPTSPIPSHPSTEIIEETVASVRFWLPDAEIIVMVDGVRDEQEHRRAAYEEYQHRLLWLCQHRWGNVLPLRFDHHQHQANMTREALTKVTTPLVLFVEHDTPLVVDCPIDWVALMRPLLAGSLDMIRLHHEALILPEHEYLMVDREKDPYVVDGCPVRRTSQWSNRPHLARSDYYRRIIKDHFPPSSSTMLEDVLHGVCQSHSWQRNRLAVYAPTDTPGNIKRSLHSDGRGDDDKYEMRFS